MSPSIRNTLVLSILSLALTNCAIGPNYEPPKTETPNTFSELYSSLTELEPEVEWWQTLDDEILNDLIQRAIKENLDLRTAEASIRGARALLREEQLEQYPIAPAEGSVTREKTSADTFGSNNSRTENFYDAGFDATWELDFFGRIRRSIEASTAEYQAAEAGWRDVFVIVTAEVARTYMELRGAQYRLDVAQRNAENQRETYYLTQALLRGGRGTDLDIARAQAQYESTLASIPPLEAETIRSIHRLSVLVGEQPSSLKKDLLTTRSLPTLPNEINVGDPASLLRRRPDIQSAERILAAATARIGIVTADLFPRITLLGSYGSRSSSLSDFTNSDNERFRIGPSFTWAAFDLGRVRARIRAADASAEGQLALYERTVLIALEETENAFSDYIRSNRRKERLTIAAEASERAAELAQLRYQNGVDSFINVLDAESRLLTAQNELARSATESGVAYVTLYKALGGGWENYQSDIRKN